MSQLVEVDEVIAVLDGLIQEFRDADLPYGSKAYTDAVSLRNKLYRQRHEFLAKKLMSQGYCVVSRAYNIVARIDRQHWREHMANKYGVDGTTWVRTLGTTRAADHYRRVYSEDRLTVDRAVLACMPSSNDGPTAFIAKED